MKAKLLVNLKTVDGTIVNAGSVFDDSNGEMPEFITGNMDNPRIVKVLDIVPTEQKEVKAEKVKKEKVPITDVKTEPKKSGIVRRK